MPGGSSMFPIAAAPSFPDPRGTRGTDGPDQVVEFPLRDQPAADGDVASVAQRLRPRMTRSQCDPMPPMIPGMPRKPAMRGWISAMTRTASGDPPGGWNSQVAHRIPLLPRRARPQGRKPTEWGRPARLDALWSLCNSTLAAAQPQSVGSRNFSHQFNGLTPKSHSLCALLAGWPR